MVEKIVFKANLIKLENFARILAKELRKGDCLALYGDLGAGKTTFTSFLAKFLGVKEKISSPTFTLINEYEGKSINIKHIDAYRLAGDDIGIEEFLKDSLVIIEWPENVKKFLSKDHIKIFLEYLNDEERAVNIEFIGKFENELIEELRNF